MIPRAPGDRCEARVGADHVRPKRGRVLILVSGAVLALSLACGTRDALVGAEDPDVERGKAGATTSGNARGAAGNSTGPGRSTGTAGGPPIGGTGQGNTTGGTEGIQSGGTAGTREAPIVEGGTPSAAGAGGAGGAIGYTCEGVAGAAGGITPCELVGALDGRLMQFPCADSPSTDDCGGLGYVVDGVVTSCSQGRSEMVLDHPIAGTPGARYLLTMHFYGIMEPKNLGPGVTREAGYLRANRDGGSPTPWATAPAGASYSLSSYSAYELHVHDEGGQEVAQYFLNSELVEEHWTFLIDYERTIEVVAGGFVRLRRYDPNCRLIKNCGATAGPPCASKARTLDLSAANPPAPPPGPFPAGFNQPGLNKSAEHGGQWWMIDVTAVQPI